jgi:hypothetical protein
VRHERCRECERARCRRCATQTYLAAFSALSLLRGSSPSGAADGVRVKPPLSRWLLPPDGVSAAIVTVDDKFQIRYHVIHRTTLKPTHVASRGKCDLPCALLRAAGARMCALSGGWWAGENMQEHTWLTSPSVAGWTRGDHKTQKNGC